MAKAKKKTESKPAEYVVAKDRLLLGPRVYVRDEKITVGNEIDEKTAAQYAKNGWIDAA